MSYIHQKHRKSRLIRVLLLVTGLYILIGSALVVFQEKLIFLPTVLEQDYKFEFNHEFEEVFLETDTDAIINAIHFKVENPKGVIVYFHGNAGDLDRWGTIAEYFVKRDYDVFIMDYRTYGKSVGPLTEEAFYHDAQFCYDYVNVRYPESDITVYGRSLGTGIATYLASQNNPKQLILETPYYSLVDVAKNRLPIFPLKSLMSYSFPTYKFMKHVSSPILIIHGTNDRVIDISSGKKLYQSSNNKQIIFVEVLNANHNNLIEFEAYHQAIKNALP